MARLRLRLAGVAPLPYPPPMSRGMVIYLAVVGGAILIGVLRVLWWLRGAELRSLARFRRGRHLEPIETSSPVENPLTEAAEQALQNIRATFSISRRLILPLLLLAAAILLGVPFLSDISATVVTLIVGLMTVVAGVVLRPLVENSIAGLVISSSKLINLGDTLSIGDKYGTVEDITITHTTIKLWDWRRYVVANTQMLQTDFINHSLVDSYVWAYVSFWVDYSAPLAEVEAIAVAAAAGSGSFAQHEAPRFWLMDTQPDAVQCWIAAWANTPADGWQLKHDIRAALIPALAERGWAPRLHRVRLDDGGQLAAPPPAALPPTKSM